MKAIGSQIRTSAASNLSVIKITHCLYRCGLRRILRLPDLLLFFIVEQKYHTYLTRIIAELGM